MPPPEIINVAQSNFVGGELSPKMRGRYELPVYQSGSEKLLNFIPELGGMKRFRPGFIYDFNTRRNNAGVLIPFQFNDAQAYEIEATEGYFRFHQNGGVLTLANVTVSGATKANPVVVTAVAHGYANGDEVIVTGVKGMTQLNNRSFIVTATTADTFQLYDNDGAAVDGTAFSTYVSGGVCNKVYELRTPYLLVDLQKLKFAQNADVVYLTHPNYEPRKLTRLGLTSWTLATFTRTADPFTSKKTISGATQANPCKITATAHGYATGAQVIIDGVIGMTQLNSRYFTVTVIDVDNFTLNGVDSTAYTAYGSAGYATDKTLCPGCCCFSDGRIIYGYSDSYPQSFWGSKALDLSGNPQYDDLTTGTTAADGYKFTLAPTASNQGKIDNIVDIIPTNKYLAIGTVSGVSAANGGSDGSPITPSTISVQPGTVEGMSSTARPFLLGIALVFMHRTGLTLYSMEFDIFYNVYNAVDKNLAADHITQSGIVHMHLQRARPQCIWMNRSDGVLVATTFMIKENINGWHRHIPGGNSSQVLDIGVMPRVNAFDQLWVITERVIGGKTRRYVEYMADEAIIPERDDYVSNPPDRDADDTQWRNAMFEAQKQYVHLDSALTYDGSDYGVVAGATMTPGAVTGNSVTFTAGAAVFASDMIGREIWKQSQNGIGSGRAKIIGYTSSTVVTCQILSPFDNLVPMAVGTWYLTTDLISGGWHIEGETAGVCTDGGDHGEVVVSSGQIPLRYQSSVVHIGLPYFGFSKSMNYEGGGSIGPSQTKMKTINRVGIRFMNTLGCQYGRDLYNMQEVEFASPSDVTGRPSPLFSGDKSVVFEDTVSRDCHVYIQQRHPLPCNILLETPFFDVDNE